jgi:hypothetical protein
LGASCTWASGGHVTLSLDTHLSHSSPHSRDVLWPLDSLALSLRHSMRQLQHLTACSHILAARGFLLGLLRHLLCLLVVVCSLVVCVECSCVLASTCCRPWLHGGLPATWVAALQQGAGGGCPVWWCAVGMVLTCSRWALGLACAGTNCAQGGMCCHMCARACWQLVKYVDSHLNVPTAQ